MRVLGYIEVTHGLLTELHHLPQIGNLRTRHNNRYSHYSKTATFAQHTEPQTSQTILFHYLNIVIFVICCVVEEP